MVVSPLIYKFKSKLMEILTNLGAVKEERHDLQMQINTNKRQITEEKDALSRQLDIARAKHDDATKVIVVIQSNLVATAAERKIQFNLNQMQH